MDTKERVSHGAVEIVSVTTVTWMVIRCLEGLSGDVISPLLTILLASIVLMILHGQATLRDGVKSLCFVAAISAMSWSIVISIDYFVYEIASKFLVIGLVVVSDVMLRAENSKLGLMLSGKTLRLENLELKEQLEITERDKNTAISRSEHMQHQCERAWRENDRLKEQLQITERDKNTAISRLSEVVGDRLVQNNPNLTDLSDQFRPTKLAEMYNELYDNEWTTAFSYINDATRAPEQNCVGILLDIIMKAHEFCHYKVHGLLQTLTSQDSEAMAAMKRLLKKKAETTRKDLSQEFTNGLWENLQQTTPGLSKSRDLSAYIDECIKLCWYMAIQDPPLIFKNTTGNGSHTSQSGGVAFSRMFFREYTKCGRYVEFVVWPVLLLHENGPVLAKGVAQGCSAWKM